MDDAWRQIGKGADQLIPAFVPEADRERLEKPLKELRSEIFHRNYMARIVPFAKSRELLERVRATGMKIALALPPTPKTLLPTARSLAWKTWWTKLLPAAMRRPPSPRPISSPPR
jgi:phosphoglycolate phosphatase-like HAD superfamily hydrolase